MRFRLKNRLVFFNVPPYKRRVFFSMIAIGSIFLASLSSYWLIDYGIRPSLRELVSVRARQIAINNIHSVIKTRIIPELEYGKLVELHLNSEGKVAYLEPKTGAINRISAVATLSIQENLMRLQSETIKIPLGQILGFKTLASYGPLLTVKIIPTGVVESSVKDRFDSAGINQVRHKIYITIKATIKMVVPLVRDYITVSTDVPLTETIIMGEVPALFLGTGGSVLEKGKF